MTSFFLHFFTSSLLNSVTPSHRHLLFFSWFLFSFLFGHTSCAFPLFSTASIQPVNCRISRSSWEAPRSICGRNRRVKIMAVQRWCAVVWCRLYMPRLYEGEGRHSYFFEFVPLSASARSAAAVVHHQPLIRRAFFRSDLLRLDAEGCFASASVSCVIGPLLRCQDC